MKVLADISIIPIGVGVSLSKYVAACERELKNAGLQPKLHAFGTNVEGDWDAVFAAVKRCHEALHGMGAPRVSTTMRLGAPAGKDQRRGDRGRSVEEKL